jgi:hypothetical protein
MARPFRGDAAMIEVGRLIHERGAIAILGDYYVAWVAQYQVNTEDGDAPAAVPVAIRTESLPLRAFRPWSRAMLAQGSMIVACVRQVPLGGWRDSTPPGSCEEKLQWFVARGAFPSATVKPLGDPIDVPPRYVLSFYQVGDCDSDVLFRSEKTEEGYAVRDGGFVIAKCRTIYENDTGPFLSRNAKVFKANH